ncbi:hypothetical protein [Laribacter hongkongensis]|uniref:hypothetical protein n=1 Tax=Laribacter hongkongensis TaxID=168471 RepID=UPI0012DF3553|nr:hypothetical protein [Laribacter hongkongensis]
MSISLAIRNIRSVFDGWRRECRIRRLVWTMNCLHLLGWRGGLRSAGVQLIREINARSPRMVARMEVKRGLA